MFGNWNALSLCKMFYAYCSKVEAEKRQHEHDVHVLEATDATAAFSGARRILDPNKAVAKYYRSGTCNAFKGAATRDIICLENAVHYLISNVWCCVVTEGCESNYDINSLCIRYNFCMDRFAAIRQDVSFLRGDNHISSQCSHQLDVSSRRQISLLLMRVTKFYFHALLVMRYYSYCRHWKGSSREAIVELRVLPPNSFDETLHEQAINLTLQSMLSLEAEGSKGDDGASDCGDVLINCINSATITSTFLYVCKSIGVTCAASTPIALGRCTVPHMDSSTHSHLNLKRHKLCSMLKNKYGGGFQYRMIIVRLILPFIDSILQGNPSRAMKLAEDGLQVSQEIEQIGDTVKSQRAQSYQIILDLKWMLACIYYSYAFPELRMWRLYLYYTASNNASPNRFEARKIQQSLHFTSEAVAVDFCRRCAFLCVDAKGEGASDDSKVVPEIYLNEWNRIGNATTNMKFKLDYLYNVPTTVSTAAVQPSKFDKRNYIAVINDIESFTGTTGSKLNCCSYCHLHLHNLVKTQRIK